MQDIVKIYSSIKPGIARKILFQGTIIASLGILVLWWLFILPFSHMEGVFGFLFFLIGMASITFGLRPYRLLMQKEKKPDELIIENQAILYMPKGTLHALIPWEVIESIQYSEKGTSYGIALNFTKEKKKKVTIYRLRENELSFLKLAKKHSCDFFIPYFSQNQAKYLEEILLTTVSKDPGRNIST